VPPTRLTDLIDIGSEFGGGISALSLVDSWAAHVLRLHREHPLPDSPDRVLWGIFDYVAALIIRDALEACLEPFAGPSPPLVEVTDELFRSMTSSDVHGHLRAQAATLGAEVLRDAWWWHRVPDGGEPRRELDKFVREPWP
jgi:hypothetical protein